VDGKYNFFLIFFLFFNSSYGHISLSVESRNSYEAILGQECTIELTIKNIPKGFKDPIIEVPNDIVLEKTGLYMSSINGNSQTKFSYSTQINEIGTHIIGPAQIEYQGKKYVSNTITIHVVTEKMESSKDKDIFLTLETENYAVIGQKIKVVASCYVKKSGISIEKLMLPSIKNVPLLNIQGPIKHDEVKINGYTYKKVSWHFDIIPETTGDFIIPAATLEYAENKQNGFFFSMFSKTKKIYSNAHHIQVSDLPPTDKVCHGVGTFTEFSSFLQPAFIKANDATTLVLHIKGEGSLLLPEGFILQNIPPSLRFYSVDKKQKDTTYTFEYVIQPKEEGLCVIEAQEFTYFNIQTKMYETLKTSPLELHIAPNPLLQKVDSPLVKNIEEDIEQEVPTKTNELNQDNTTDVTQKEFDAEKQKEYKIPLFYFILLILFLVFPYFFFIYKQKSIVLHAYYHKTIFYCMVIHTHIFILILGKKLDARQIKTLFSRLIARYFSCNQEMTYLYYERLAEKIDQKTGTYGSWQRFFQLINQATYGKKRVEQKEIDQLSKEACVWLRIFRSL